MVQKYDSKIIKDASDFGISPKSISYSELGVCMGEESAHPGSYLFCIASGEVVPRKVFSLTHAWPWDWQRKFSPKAELMLPKVPRHMYNIQTQQRIDAPDRLQDQWNDIGNIQLPGSYDKNSLSTDQNCTNIYGSPSLSDHILPSPHSYPHYLPRSQGAAGATAASSDLNFMDHSHNADGTATVAMQSPPINIIVPPHNDRPGISPPVTPFRPAVTVHRSETSPPVPPVRPNFLPLSQRTEPITPTVIRPSLVEVVPVSPVNDQPVIPVNAPVLPVPPVFTEPRRSTRIRKPTVPGSHRSYVCNSSSVDASETQWTQVGKSKKSVQFPFPSIPIPPTTHIDNFIVPTEQHGDMTIKDAISYFATGPFILPEQHAFLSASHLKPQPTSKCMEKTLKQALKPTFAVASSFVHAAVIKHLDMLTNDLGTISLLAPADIQADSVKVYGQILIKLKHDNRITARLAAGGNRQPISSHGETFAPTASESSSNLLLAAYQAFGKSSSVPIHFNTFDLSNAFQNTLLDKVNYPQQIVMLMPDNLPGKYAGFSNQWVEVHKAINGLKQSNELFDRDIRHQMHLAGFTETCDPCVYHKQDPTDPLAKCTINMHVDEGASVDSSDKLYQDAVTQLTLRWGTLKQQSGSNIVYNGKNILTHSNGAISISMDSYIQRASKELGVAHLPPVSSPSNADFFNDSIDTTPADKLLYSQLNGCLTHVVTKGRFDVKKESGFLSKFLANPDAGHMSKMITVWQYLNCTSTIGPVYDTDEGVTLVLHVDSAFGVHTNGTSHTGAYLSIGRFNAPIWVMSKPQDHVALSPQASEYYGLSDPCQDLLWHRQLLHDIGFPQDRTIVYEDNIPAINLAYSPQITRKSRYMHVRHHFIRALVKNKTIKICHVDSTIQAADLLTHPMRPAPFKRHRHRLFNLKSIPISDSG